MGGRSCPEAENMVSLLLSSNEVFILNSEVKDFLFQKKTYILVATQIIFLYVIVSNFFTCISIYEINKHYLGFHMKLKKQHSNSAKIIVFKHYGLNIFL